MTLDQLKNGKINDGKCGGSANKALHGEHVDMGTIKVDGKEGRKDHSNVDVIAAAATTTATTTTAIASVPVTTLKQQNNTNNPVGIKGVTASTNQEQEFSKQNDITISFLRAARSGDLNKVLEFLDTHQVTDINTCNANGLNALHLAAKDGYIDIVRELLKRGIRVDNATKKGNTALHIASLAGQKDVIKLLIQYEANVNVQSLNGFTPLYMAAQENHDACVRYLLSKGANPALATEDGFTPLAVAMQQGHDKVVAVLLEGDVRGKMRLPALHIAAKKDDVAAAAMLLQYKDNADIVSKSGFTPLHIAAHYGNKDIAKLLIDKGADVNYTAKHNITPLHVACKWGKTNILELLLMNNAYIEATTRDGLTPLHCAARSGHVEVLDILIKHNASITSKTKNGLAALHMAAQGEHVDAARLLLDYKASVDDVTVDYLTALHVAAHCGHVRVANLLLDYGADPNARALNGFTPLHIACKKNRIKIVELLLKHGANIDATTESGLTPLHVASFMGCMNIVIYLMQHEANPNAATIRGETSLHLATRANQTDIIRILLRNGAQVDMRAREGQSALHVASRLGNTDIIMLLLQHGADVNALAKDNYTSLHIAAKEGWDEAVQLLCDNNAECEAITRKGFTPLHLAAKYGKEKTVEQLLYRGASVNSQGGNGVTPLHVAAHYNHPTIVRLLLEHGADPLLCARNGHTALHTAAQKNLLDIAQTLLNHGADSKIRSKSGFTALHLATQEGHTEMVQLLLEHGADTNIPAKNGLTAMHLAAQEDHCNVARLLLDHHANISSRTKNGYTPLHCAAHYGQVNMVKFLLENDANIEMTTNVGYTPLHQAAQQGHIVIINLLLRHKANPNALTKNGQTPLSIADSLGYITAVETLKVVTEISIQQTLSGTTGEKYNVVTPELMHEAYLSDSEEEGNDDEMLDHQYQYKYMVSNDLRASNEQDNRNYDTTVVIEQDNVYNSATNNMDLMKDSEVVPMQVNQLKTNNTMKPPVHLGFLVSFMVDARGGAMRGCRHSGVRIIVLPKSCAQPTRITCRYVKSQKVLSPPPLMEGEALISRILELSPFEIKFLRPVILEVPHFGSLRDKEREIIILRSDNGESWCEHTSVEYGDNIAEMLNKILNDGLTSLENLHTNRIVRIVTNSFPHFFAVVSRIRQEVHVIGPDGGTVSSQVVPQVQAIFPPNALTKKIRVGLQAQPVTVCNNLLGQGVAVSPVVTVEPRRRKFHKAITLSIPAPKNSTKQNMMNPLHSCNINTLRLLCSITGGQNHAIWEDVTGSTPLAFVKDSVTFTTTVSARFWLMNCHNIADTSRIASELYAYMTQAPFVAKFVVFSKRISENEAKLSVFCMTDDKEDKTLEQQDNFIEVAKSKDVELLDGQQVYIEFSGHIMPVLKTDERLLMNFQAFRENRLSCLVRIKLPEEPHGTISFISESRLSSITESIVKQPVCVLNLNLQNEVFNNEDSSSTKYIEDNNQQTITFIDKDLYHRNKINSAYQQYHCTLNNVSALNKKHLSDDQESFDHQQELNIDMAELQVSNIGERLGSDWQPLAKALGVPETDIELINAEHDKENQCATAMLQLWLRQKGHEANENTLQQALEKIGRNDILTYHIKNINLTIQANEKKFTENNSTTPDDLFHREKYEVVELNNSKLKDVKNSIDDKESSAVCVIKDSIVGKPIGDLDLIRSIAEEHTRQVLEEAQLKIENQEELMKLKKESYHNDIHGMYTKADKVIPSQLENKMLAAFPTNKAIHFSDQSASCAMFINEIQRVERMENQQRLFNNNNNNDNDNDNNNNDNK